MGYGIEREVWLTAANRQGPILVCSHTKIWSQCSLGIATLVVHRTTATQGPRCSHHFCCLKVVSNVEHLIINMGHQFCLFVFCFFEEKMDQQLNLVTVVVVG